MNNHIRFQRNILKSYCSYNSKHEISWRIRDKVKETQKLTTIEYHQNQSK